MWSGRRIYQYIEKCYNQAINAKQKAKDHNEFLDLAHHLRQWLPSDAGAACVYAASQHILEPKSVGHYVEKVFDYNSGSQWVLFKAGQQAWDAVRRYHGPDGRRYYVTQLKYTAVKYKDGGGEGRVSIWVSVNHNLPKSSLHVMLWDPVFNQVLLYRIPPSGYMDQLVMKNDGSRYRLDMSFPDWQVQFGQYLCHNIRSWAS